MLDAGSWISNQRQPYDFIETKSELPALAESLQKEPALAVDLEADSLFHYQEKVCLIQVATASNRNILIDPLSVRDLSPLRPVFLDSSIRKVFHGADYDIRSLYRDFGFEISGLFDTQIAARFLGYKETGLAKLLESHFNVVLEKKCQKKDWSKRPLPSTMLAYAVNDVSYLLSLADVLEEDLRTVGRLYFVEEECMIQSKVRPAPPNKRPFYVNFRGARKLGSRGLAALEGILALRDRLARKWDLPPFKIIGNGTVLEIAMKKPKTEKALSKIPGMSKKQMGRLGRSILISLEKASRMKSEELPSFPPRQRKNNRPGVTQRVKTAKAWREKKSVKLALDPSLILTNAQIRALAMAYPKSIMDLHKIEDLRQWQIEAFGEEICALLNP
jgi:ribonuclease D